MEFPSLLLIIGLFGGKFVLKRHKRRTRQCQKVFSMGNGGSRLGVSARYKEIEQIRVYILLAETP